MIRKIANLAINMGRIQDLDTIMTLGGQLTSADVPAEYIAATDIDEGNVSTWGSLCS